MGATVQRFGRGLAFGRPLINILSWKKEVHFGMAALESANRRKQAAVKRSHLDSAKVEVHYAVLIDIPLNVAAQVQDLHANKEVQVHSDLLKLKLHGLEQLGRWWR